MGKLEVPAKAAEAVMSGVLKTKPHLLLIDVDGVDSAQGFTWYGKFSCHGKGMPAGEAGHHFVANVLRTVADVIEGGDGRA